MNLACMQLPKDYHLSDLLNIIIFYGILNVANIAEWCDSELDLN